MLAWSVRVAVSGVIFGLVSVSSALATPTFINPNFVPGSAVPGNDYYNYTTAVDSWQGSVGNTAYTAQNGSYLWDNGSAGVTSVLALNGYTSGVSEFVNGFIIGEMYSVSAKVNARAYNQPSALALTVNDGVLTSLVGSATINAVDIAGFFQTPFTTFTSSSFVATSTSLLFNFYNAQLGESSVLLTNASISDLGSAVPEPFSLGLLSLALVFTAGVSMTRSHVKGS